MLVSCRAYEIQVLALDTLLSRGGTTDTPLVVNQQWSSRIWTNSRSGLMRTPWCSTSPSAKCCTQVRAIANMNTEWENPEKGLGVLFSERLDMSPQLHFQMQSRKSTVSWAASEEVWPAGWERGLSHSILPLWDPIWSAASISGILSTRKILISYSGSREGLQIWSEGWSISPTKTGQES